MKRILAFLCLAAMLAGLFTACGAKETTIDIAKAKEQIVSDLQIENPADMEPDDLLSYYGIAAEDVEQSACFLTMAGAFPDEVIMIQAVDTDAAARVQEKLEARLETVKATSKNYDAESYQVAQTCKVQVDGRYVALFVSANHEKMEEIYDSYK